MDLAGWMCVRRGLGIGGKGWFCGRVGVRCTGVDVRIDVC